MNILFWLCKFWLKSREKRVPERGRRDANIVYKLPKIKTCI
jgi:hypothetical protein